MDVRLYQGESEYWMDNGLPDNISVISDEQKEQIRSLEGVESATFYNRRGYADGITYRNTSLDSGSVYGVDAMEMMEAIPIIIPSMVKNDRIL